MKNIRIAIALATVILSAVSCKKTGNQLFKGYYSFKTSGTLTIEAKTDKETEEGEEETPITYTINLSNENGQMNILDVDAKDGKMALTMNIVSGPVVVTEATTNDKKLTVSPFERILTLKDENGSNLEMTVTISGTGQKLDNMVMIDLIYSGQTQKESWTGTTTTYTIDSSNVVCVAREN